MGRSGEGGVSKVIVITGGGTGLGRALARRFAAEGERLALLGRRLDKVEAVAAELGDCAVPVQCDVSSPDSVRAAFSAIAGRYGQIDVLINNAAVFKPFLVAEASDEQILQAVGTNLTGPILCARSAIPLMPRGGCILNVSTEVVGHHYYPFFTLYGASKAGMERFSLNLAQELEPQGIRVSIVRAGQMIDEDMDWGDLDLAQIARFHEAATAAGFDLRGSPKSQFASVTGVFRTLIDLPADVTAASTWLHARAP
jgi:NAD(P)-dependent dehydrogenase (short-subunit alcohol dehydrogenase family)